jgi:hypothetical protein
MTFSEIVIVLPCWWPWKQTQSVHKNTNDHFLVNLNFLIFNLWYTCITISSKYVFSWTLQVEIAVFTECDVLQCRLHPCRAQRWRNHGQDHLHKGCPSRIAQDWPESHHHIHRGRRRHSLGGPVAIESTVSEVLRGSSQAFILGGLEWPFFFSLG